MNKYLARMKALRASEKKEMHYPGDCQSCQKSPEQSFFSDNALPQGLSKLPKVDNLGEPPSWLAVITSWQPPSSDMAAVKEAALQFLASEWAERAIALGWDEIDLFGLFPKREFARFRIGSWGLVTHLGLSIHKPQIVLISEDCATIRTVGGATQTKPRALPEAKISRPFWECC